MANNPYVNKVVYGNNTVMDISDTTAEESDVASGKTFYKASGAKGVGSAVTPDISNCYQSTDSQETDIQDADYFPFYDSSATAKKNTLWSNIKAKLKTYFDTLYATYLGVSGLIETTVGWSTKNILNCDIASETQTINGLTVNVSRTTGGDLIYIKVSGTATATTDIEVASSVSDNEYGELSGNAYILNGCPSGGSSTTYSLVLRGSYGSGAQDTGSGALISGTVTNGKVYIRIYNGYTASNLQFKPMIRSKYVADDTYEAYHNNVKDELAKKADTSAIPTSLSQLSDDSTHRVVTDAEKATWNGKVSESLLKDTVGWVGKNLLNNNADSRTNNGITFTVNSDGSVTVNGTATATAFWGVQFSLPVGSYVLNGCPSGGGSNTYIIDFRNAVGGSGIPGLSGDSGNGYTFTLESPLTAYLNIRIANGYTANNLVFKPMLRDASITDSTFEPFHPSVEDSKFDRAEQRVLGAKNLLPYPIGTRQVIANDGTITNNSEFYCSDFIEINGSPIILSCDSEVGEVYGRCAFYTSAKAFISRPTAGVFPFSPTVPSDAKYVRICMEDVSANNLTKPMLRLASDPDNTYVPYAMTNRELTDAIHTMTPTPSASLTEQNVVTAVNAALIEGGINDDVPSNFDMGKWSNTMSKAFLVQGVAGSSTPVGTTGVGTFPADPQNPTSAEKADWMCIPELYGCGSALGINFDLVYDPATVSVPIARGGYVIDDNETMSDGQGGTIPCAKMCIKFANEIPEADTHTAVVGAEITIKRTETVFVG